MLKGDRATDAEQFALIKSYLASPVGSAGTAEPSIWRAFFDDYDGRIRAAIRVCHTREKDIDNLTQDVWCILVKRLPTLILDPARGTLREWITGIAHRQAGWCSVRQKRRQDLSLTPDLTAALLDPGAGPAAVFDRQQRQDQVRTLVEGVVAGLPAPNDRVLSMHWIGERTAKEIAAELGINGNQVRAIIRRGRLKLSVALKCNGFR